MVNSEDTTKMTMGITTTIKEFNEDIQSIFYDEKSKHKLHFVRGHFSNARLALIVDDELQEESKIFLGSNRVSRKDINKLHNFCIENSIKKYEIIFDSVWYEWDSEYSDFERTDVEVSVSIFKN